MIVLALFTAGVLAACGQTGINPRGILASQTSSASPTFTVTASAVPTETPVPSDTPTEIPTEPATELPTATATQTETASPTPTLDGSQTATLTPTITPTATRTRIPSRTPYPTRTRRPTRTPTITPTPTPGLAPFRINNYAPYSKVVSPVRPEAIVSPGEDGFIYVDLIGEDGRTITREGLNFRNYIGRRFGIAPEIEFELESVAETGRLVISTFDLEGRTMALTSVDLVLLRLGSNDISAPLDLTEPYIIRQPQEEDVIRGGMLRVVGLARILNINPILIECIAENGEVITSTEVLLHAPTEEFSHIPFEAYLPYTVNEPTNVRLTIRQESATRLPGTIYLQSFELVLSP